jgi:hypothetical protein
MTIITMTTTTIVIITIIAPVGRAMLLESAMTVSHSMIEKRRSRAEVALMVTESNSDCV